MLGIAISDTTLVTKLPNDPELFYIDRKQFKLSPAHGYSVLNLMRNWQITSAEFDRLIGATLRQVIKAEQYATPHLSSNLEKLRAALGPAKRKPSLKKKRNLKKKPKPTPKPVTRIPYKKIPETEVLEEFPDPLEPFEQKVVDFYAPMMLAEEEKHRQLKVAQVVRRHQGYRGAKDRIKMVDELLELKVPLEEVANLIGITKSHLTRFLRKHGKYLRPEQSPARLAALDLQIQEALPDVVTGRIRVDKLSKELGTTRGRIRRIMEQKGVSLPKLSYPSRKLRASVIRQLNQILPLLAEGKTIYKACEELGAAYPRTCARTIQQALKRLENQGYSPDYLMEHGLPYQRNPYQDEWHDKIEALARENEYPFSNWFDETDRVYLTFQQLTGADQEVFETLRIGNYEITDYRKGLCARPGSKTQQRIGKVLRRLKEKDEQEIREKHARGELYHLSRELKENDRYWDRLLSQFNASNFRSGSNEPLVVVISQCPHDVAKMSTERAWESCMTLRVGSGSAGAHQDAVLQEVESGGLVSYLIRPEDRDIKKPLSRIHIRRFEDRNKRSWAIPEQTVYGEEVEGYLDFLEDWILTNQGPVPPGIYRLQGSPHSDTFDKSMVVTPEDLPTLIEWFRKIGLPEPYSRWVVSREVDDMGFEDEENAEPGEVAFDTKEEAERYLRHAPLNDDTTWREHFIDEDTGDRGYWAELADPDDEEGEFLHPAYSLDEIVVDDRPGMQLQAAMALANLPKNIVPLALIQEIKMFSQEIIGHRKVSLQEVLRRQYPELFTEQEIDTLSKYDYINFLKTLSAAQRQPYLQSVLQRLAHFAEHPSLYLPKCLVCKQPIDPTTVETVICPRGNLLHHASCPQECAQLSFGDATDASNRGHRRYLQETGKISDIFSPAQEFIRPIPEPIIRNLVTAADRTALWGEERARLQSYIVHLLHITKSDTPTVQRFYESLLPEWPYEIPEDKDPHKILYRKHRELNIDNLGVAIGTLGINARQFLPFIQDRIDRLVQDFGPELKDPEYRPSDPSLSEVWRRAGIILEKYLYLQDSIQSGLGRSEKYQFFGH